MIIPSAVSRRYRGGGAPLSSGRRVGDRKRYSIPPPPLRAFPWRAADVTGGGSCNPQETRARQTGGDRGLMAGTAPAAATLRQPEPLRKGTHGPTGRVRAPDARGARHPFCPAVVHGCARVPQVGRG